MGQITKLLIIMIVSSGIYTLFSKVKSDIGYFISFLVAISVWLIIKNIAMEFGDGT